MFIFQTAMTVYNESSSENESIEEDDTALDDPSLYEDMSLEEIGSTAIRMGERLPRFAHSLQLCICYGLQKIGNSCSATAKCVKLASLVYQSALFRATFEDAFGASRSLPQENDIRWNSFCRQLVTISNLNKVVLSDMLKNSSQANLIMTQREGLQIKEINEVLEPLAHATEFLQSDSYVTLSCIVPIVFSLHNKSIGFATTS